MKGWVAGKSVGYYLDCSILISEDQVKEITRNSHASDSTPCNTNSGNDSKQGNSTCSELSITQNGENEEKSSKTSSKRKAKPGRKATWSSYALYDLVDIIVSSENYKRKLIFTNTKHQTNGVIYDQILSEMKKRGNEKGDLITFTVKQIRTKFKSCVSNCKQAAMKIKTSTGIERFQDEKGYGEWFIMLFPLVKTWDSCQPDVAVEPSAIHDLSEEEEVAKTLDDFIPIKKVKLPKKNKAAEAVELLKRVVEQDSTKELINFMKEEAEKARKHELELVELMLKHNNSYQGNVNQSIPQGQSSTLYTTDQAVAWNTFHHHFSFQNENPQYHLPTTITHPPNVVIPPSDTRVYANCFIGPSLGEHLRKLWLPNIQFFKILVITMLT